MDKIECPECGHEEMKVDSKLIFFATQYEPAEYVHRYTCPECLHEEIE